MTKEGQKVKVQPRRISRELVLLSVSQLSNQSRDLTKVELQQLVSSAIHALSTEIQDAIELASSELERSNNQLLNSETRATDLGSARTMVQEAITLAQRAINRLGTVVDIPNLLEKVDQKDVHDYGLHILATLLQQRDEIDMILNQSMVDWSMGRLARIDQDILRIAVTEMAYLELPHQVAINEAVELAKRYSEQDGYRFINGVLRRVSDRLNKGIRSQ
ncbi:MAG: transcription antitermination factor NusB [Leptolyngbyaceae bacterium]|nr:transcription antitermination factor NusB [Leptolyngbyaceae bacterium]